MGWFFFFSLFDYLTIFPIWLGNFTTQVFHLWGFLNDSLFSNKISICAQNKSIGDDNSWTSDTNKIFFKAFINLRNSFMYQNKKMQVVTACRAIWMTPLHIVTGGLSLTLHGCPTIKRLWHKLRPLAAIRGQSVPPALRAELGRADLPDRARGRVRKRLCAVTGTPACQLFPGRELPSPMLTAREPDEPSVSSNCLTGFTAHSHLVGGTISHFKRACCLYSALMYFHFAPALWEKSIFTERREANGVS